MKRKIRDNYVHYKSYGEGKPIILLHGWTLDYHSMVSTFEPIFEQRQGWKRIYPDLPGHGETPGQDWIQNQDNMLEVVLEFIDQEVEEKSFVIGGVSAGAYLARGVVYQKQKSVDGLLLVVPLVYAEDDKRNLPPPTVIVEEQDLFTDLSEIEANILGMAVVQNQEILNKIRMEMELKVEEGDVDFRAAIRENPKRYAFSFDVDRLPERFDKPTLILSGKQDPFVGYQDAWMLAEKYPRCTYAVLDRAGHLLELEQEILLHTLVNEWIDRVEEISEG